jgi:hypothetical protein
MSYTKMWEEIKAAEKAKAEPEKKEPTLDVLDGFVEQYNESSASSLGFYGELPKVTLKEWLATHVESKQPDLISLPYIKSDRGFFREHPTHIDRHRVRVNGEGWDVWVGIVFEHIRENIPYDEILFSLSREQAEQLIQNLNEQLG